MQILIILFIITIVLGVGNHQGVMEVISQPFLLRWEVYAFSGLLLMIILLTIVIIKIRKAYLEIRGGLRELQNKKVAAPVVVPVVKPSGKRSYSTTSTPLSPSKPRVFVSPNPTLTVRGFKTSSWLNAALSLMGMKPWFPASQQRGSEFSVTNPSTYARLLNTVKPVNAMISVKGGRPLVNHILRMCSLIGLDKSLGLVKVIIAFMSFCFKYIQSNGLNGLVIYLKACTVILQQASGKHKLESMNGLKIRFARTRSGYPRVIPMLHRARIHEPKIFKLWMTLFSLYRVLEVPGKLNLSTITNPSTMDPSNLPKISQLLETAFWPGLINLSRFDDTRIGQNWLEPWDFIRSLRATPFIIRKASSAAGWIRLTTAETATVQSTAPASILAAIVAWKDNPMMFTILKDWCNMTGNVWLLNRIDSWSRILLTMCDPSDSRIELYKGMRTVLGQTYGRTLGKLGFKEEAAGKVRVFAFVDPFTQWLMKPLHDALFEILSLIPQDGTTDQLAPVRLLISRKPKGPFFSYDLTAATDRLPLIVQMTILSKLMTSHGANLWASMLVGRQYDYVYKPVKGKTQRGTVVYGAGQPMGALSSWAMLAFTHHAIVQMASFDAGKTKSGEWFADYAVLGDDIVIADAAVASSYLSLMEILGVNIGLAKSLVSLDGQTLEFAKKTIHRKADVSAVPFSEYWIGRQSLGPSLELVSKYKLTLSKYLDIFGFGFRAKGSMSGDIMSLGRRMRHRILAYFSPLGPNPLTMREFFSLKGINRFYKWTDRKEISLVTNFVAKELQRLLEKLDSPEMIVLVDNARQLSEVNKDREYYGTKRRDAPGARKLDLPGLHPERPTYAWSASSPDVRYIDKQIYYEVTDELCQTIYREAFLDVRVMVRDLRYAIEDAIKAKSGPSVGDLDMVLTKYQEFQDLLAEVPFPKEITIKPKEEARVSQLELIKQWEVYSRYLRSTLST
jgi:hypothetical protein